MRKQIGRGYWAHRRDLADGAVRDVWYAKDYGVAVKTRLGWFAGNGHMRIFRELSEDPEMVEPKVGPCKTYEEAIAAYDAQMGESR